MERDAQRVLTYLRESPLQTITGPGLVDWMRKQEPPWTSGYWKAVRERAIESMRARTEEDGASTRARLLSFIDGMLPKCSTYRTGTGSGIGAGTVVLEDPVTGEHMVEIDHSAVQGYLKIIASLTGAEAPQKHLHAHAGIGDLKEMSDAELMRLTDVTPLDP